MRKIQLTLFLVLGVSLVSGCQKKASDVVDIGEIVDNVYTNEYFGVRMDIPPTWHVQDQETQREIVESGLESLNSDQKAVEASLEQRTVNLFAVFKYKIGSPTFNPNILALAERTSDVPGLERGRDYHVYTKKMFASSSAAVSYPKEIYTETIGGVDFDIMTIKFQNLNTPAFHKQYATVINGYVLLFGLSYENEGDEAELDGIVHTLSFQP